MLAELLQLVVNGEINQNTAKAVLAEMFKGGRTAGAIVREQGLRQVSDISTISDWVQSTLAANSEQVASYLAGKETVSRWLFGQVMRLAQGKANPQLIQHELDRQLAELKDGQYRG